MKILVNEKISQHKFKTPEGYLVCVDSVLARTGKQTYRKNELFLDGDDSEIEIDRTPEEVFSEQTLASFENKPITLEHPHEDVTVDNYKDYAIGFVRDVKQGTFDGQPVILGTLVFTDAEAIREIEEGTRTELSCGYDCDIEDDENPRQTHIRGNHVALCEAGRAGIAKVIDSTKVNDDIGVLGYIPSKNITYQANKLVDGQTYVSPRLNRMGSENFDNDHHYWIEFEFKPSGDFPNHNKNLKVLVYLYALDKADALNCANIMAERSYLAYGLWEVEDIKIEKKPSRLKDSIEDDEFEMSKDEAIREIEKILKDKRYVREDRYEGVEYFTREGMDKVVEIVDKSGLTRKELEKISYLFGKGAYGPYFDSTPDEEQTTMLEEDLEHFEDVDPRSGESKDEFIARFMEETKNEYPNEKQRLAVAYSYWKNKGKDSMIKDYKWKIIYGKGKPGKKEEVIEANTYREAKEYAAKNAHGWGFEIHNIDLTDSAVKDANIRLTLKKKKNDYGEFKVVCMKNGKYDEEGTYYTDDWDDAVGTLKQMAKQMGLNVTQNGNSYVADSKKAEDSLREPPESIVKAFEQQLAKWGIKIVGKGRTMMGRKHYQVETDMNPIKLHNVLKSIDIWLDKEQVPMTWSIGTDENGVTNAGIDLDKQFISDSKSKDASALDFEREVLSCWNAIKRENPDIYEEVLEGYKNADIRTLWGLLYEVADKTSLHRENPELFRRAKRVWNKYKNIDMNVRNIASFDSIYTLKIDGQKSRKLVRAKDASEAIEKYKKMFPKERIISVEQSEKFNKIVRNIPR